MMILFCSLNATEKPKLIVFISIDQMRAGHLDRYAREFSSGFQRLMTKGVWYTHAELGYANTSTAPGHATMSTGVYPWKSGIVGNNYHDRKANRRVYSVEDSTVLPLGSEGGRRSPRNLLAATIGDMLKSSSAYSRVISISYKDRAAILMGGLKADLALWYDRLHAGMMSSTYYGAALPEWARSFDGKKWIETNVPDSWIRLKPPAVYDRYGPDAVEGEGLWDGKTSFPHDFTKGKKFVQLFDSPYGNLLLLDVARRAIDGEQLGRRGVTDLLCISLSPTDNIGSTFGPDSHEMVDNLLRLDLALGAFFDDLAEAAGKENVLIVLTGDHGVMPLPEYLANIEHSPARRIDNKKDVQLKLKALDSLTRIEMNASEQVVREGFINYHLLKKAGVEPQVFERRVREALLGVDGVADVYFARELLDPTTAPRPYLDAYRHSLMKERAPDFAIRDCENCLNTAAKTGTEHGSPYAYDARVPIVFLGPNLKPMKVERLVHTVDIVPTLVKLLTLPAFPGLDGVALNEVLN
jgi:predicted AlkP superfamily pyrophosphatase or phosphodiesterase